ncbi:MAG: vWA domain-containing protein, partial [Dermatophilaceae bacterium]
MSRQRWRRVCAVLACAAGLLATHADASHAADPPTLSMSDVKGDSSSVSGMLTVRSQSPAQVDPNTLKASIDGKDAPVRITQTPPRQRRAMLVVDTSGSMGASGMATVRAAAAQYLHDVPSDVLVGVATFADTAGVDLSPSSDRSAAQQVVNGLVSRGDTSLYAGVQSALAVLGAEGDRSMVLLSDGADTIAANKAASRDSVTAALTSAGVRVDVVQFKT